MACCLCCLRVAPCPARKFLTLLFRRCGLDTLKYKGHSFRIGAATFAAECGFSDAQIRAMGALAIRCIPQIYSHTKLKFCFILIATDCGCILVFARQTVSSRR